MEPVPLELQVQIRVGKPTRPPMLERHDLARLRGEFAADLAAPRPVFEGPPQPGRPLDRRDVLPGLVVAGAVSTMQCVDDAEPRLSRRVEYLRHVSHTAIGFGDGLQATPHLATLGEDRK